MSEWRLASATVRAPSHHRTGTITARASISGVTTIMHEGEGTIEQINLGMRRGKRLTKRHVVGVGTSMDQTLSRVNVTITPLTMVGHNEREARMSVREMRTNRFDGTTAITFKSTNRTGESLLHLVHKERQCKPRRGQLTVGHTLAIMKETLMPCERPTRFKRPKTKRTGRHDTMKLSKKVLETRKVQKPWKTQRKHQIPRSEPTSR